MIPRQISPRREIQSFDVPRARRRSALESLPEESKEEASDRDGDEITRMKQRERARLRSVGGLPSSATPHTTALRSPSSRCRYPRHFESIGRRNAEQFIASPVAGTHKNGLVYGKPLPPIPTPQGGEWFAGTRAWGHLSAEAGRQQYRPSSSSSEAFRKRSGEHIYDNLSRSQDWTKSASSKPRSHGMAHQQARNASQGDAIHTAWTLRTQPVRPTLVNAYQSVERHSHPETSGEYHARNRDKHHAANPSAMNAISTTSSTHPDLTNTGGTPGNGATRQDPERAQKQRAASLRTVQTAPATTTLRGANTITPIQRSSSTPLFVDMQRSSTFSRANPQCIPLRRRQYPSISLVFSEGAKSNDSNFMRTNFTRKENARPGEAGRISKAASAVNSRTCSKVPVSNLGRPTPQVPARYRKIRPRLQTQHQNQDSVNSQGSDGSPVSPGSSVGGVYASSPSPVLSRPSWNGSVVSADYGTLGQPAVANPSIPQSVSSDGEQESPVLPPTRHPCALPPLTLSEQTIATAEAPNDTSSTPTTSSSSASTSTTSFSSGNPGPSLIPTPLTPLLCPANCSCNACYTLYIRRRLTTCNIPARLRALLSTTHCFATIAFDLPPHLTLQLHTCILRSNSLHRAQTRLQNRERPFLLEQDPVRPRESWNRWVEAFVWNVKELEGLVGVAEAAVAAWREEVQTAKGRSLERAKEVTGWRKRLSRKLRLRSRGKVGADGDCGDAVERMGMSAEEVEADRRKKARMKWFGRRRIDSINF